LPEEVLTNAEDKADRHETTTAELLIRKLRHEIAVDTQRLADGSRDGGIIICVGNAVGRLPATEQARQAQKIKAERAQTEQTIHQLEDDIATAQKLGSQMDATEMQRLLAPVDG